MLNRIVREALKNDNSEVDSEQAETNESMMVKAKNSRMYSKMMESMPKNSQARTKEMEIESKLNSIYNRLV